MRNRSNRARSLTITEWTSWRLAPDQATSGPSAPKTSAIAAGNRATAPDAGQSGISTGTNVAALTNSATCGRQNNTLAYQSPSTVDDDGGSTVGRPTRSRNFYVPRTVNTTTPPRAPFQAPCTPRRATARVAAPCNLAVRATEHHDEPFAGSTARTARATDRRPRAAARRPSTRCPHDRRQLQPLLHLRSRPRGSLVLTVA